MKDTQSHLSHEYISPIEVEIKIEVTFAEDLEIVHIGDAHCTIKTLEVDTGVNLIIGEIMDITHEVSKDIGTIIKTIGEAIIGVKITIGIGVGH